MSDTPRTLHAVSGETDWKCEACGTSGRIYYDPAATVYDVIAILANAHEKANGGTCRDLSKVRVKLVEHPAAHPPSEEPPQV